MCSISRRLLSGSCVSPAWVYVSTGNVLSERVFLFSLFTMELTRVRVSHRADSFSVTQHWRLVLFPSKGPLFFSLLFKLLIFFFCAVWNPWRSQMQLFWWEFTPLYTRHSNLNFCFCFDPFEVVSVQNRKSYFWVPVLRKGFEAQSPTASRRYSEL